MPTPIKTTDITPPPEGVWVNEDGQGYITETADKTTLTRAEQEKILNDWIKWKKDNPRLYLAGSITPFIGTMMSRYDYLSEPSFENALGYSMSATGDAALFMPKYITKLYRGFKLAKKPVRNLVRTVASAIGKIDDFNDIADYYNENVIGQTAQPVTEPTHTPKLREARPDFEGVMLPEVVVTADRVRNTIMKWSVHR